MLDHPQEMYKTHTPYEKRRLEKMHIRGTRYGFFRVATESISHDICDRCEKEINGQKLVLNGVITHYHKSSCEE